MQAVKKNGRRESVDRALTPIRVCVTSKRKHTHTKCVIRHQTFQDFVTGGETLITHSKQPISVLEGNNKYPILVSYVAT